MNKKGRFLFPQDPPLELGMLRPDRGRYDSFWASVHGQRFFVYYARNAIYHGLTVLGLPADAEILVPAFHCAAAIEPIRAYGATVSFYRIGPDLLADLDDIERRITDRVRAVMCIHYFGFPQQAVKLKAICEQRGLSLIEDCAHVITGSVDQVPLGAAGDISVFSLRKFFPTNDGGMLVINCASGAPIPKLREPGAWHTSKIFKNLLELGLQNSRTSGARKLGRLLERLRPPSGPSPEQRDSDAGPGNLDDVDWSSVHFEMRNVDIKMSRFSRWILGHQNVARSIQRRRQNYHVLARRLADLPKARLVFPHLPDDVCPLVCPLILDGEPEYHLALRARGIPATTWGKVVHPALRRSEFPEANHLYSNLVFLPVHQGLSVEEMEAMARLVREVVVSET